MRVEKTHRGAASRRPRGVRGVEASARRGAGPVEFALITAPLLFLLLFGILEFGVVIWRYNTVANAAREGRGQRPSFTSRAARPGESQGGPGGR